jgi:hypothetical protein
MTSYTFPTPSGNTDTDFNNLAFTDNFLAEQEQAWIWAPNGFGLNDYSQTQIP